MKNYLLVNYNTNIDQISLKTSKKNKLSNQKDCQSFEATRWI